MAYIETVEAKITRFRAVCREAILANGDDPTEDDLLREIDAFLHKPHALCQHQITNLKIRAEQAAQAARAELASLSRQ